MKISREEVHAYKSARGGWSRAQLAALRVAWPPRHGWIDEVAQTEYSAEEIERFVSLRNAHIKGGAAEQQDLFPLSLKGDDRPRVWRCRKCGRSSRTFRNSCSHCLTEDVGSYLLPQDFDYPPWEDAPQSSGNSPM